MLRAASGGRNRKRSPETKKNAFASTSLPEMWREFDALNELIVEHLLGPVAKVVVRYLSSHSSATLRELKRSLRTQLLDRVRISGITPSNRFILQTILRACLTTLIELGVVRYRYEHPDLPNSRCVYALSRSGALWLYGFPFLQRYVLRLHCVSWRLEAERGLRPGESKELAQASAHVGTGAISKEIQTVIDLCSRVPPFGRKSICSLWDEMPNKDQRWSMNRDMLRFLIGIGLVERCSEEACVAEMLGMTPHRSESFHGDTNWSNAGASKPGYRIDEAGNSEASVCRNETTASRDSGVSRLEQKLLPTNGHLTVGVSGQSPGERPRMRRRIRLRKLDTKAESEEFNGSNIQDTNPDTLPGPTIPVVSDSAPAPAVPTDSTKDELDSFISTNLVFVRDAIRHLHISFWAAEQLHSCEDSGSASPPAQVHWRPVVHQTASILNALFYLQRVATHGVLTDVLPRELLDPSWSAEASWKGFTLEQIYYVVLYRFCVPSDASLEALSPAVVQSTLSHLADDRLCFVKVYNWRNIQLYAPLYTLLLERYRLHCIEGMLLASGDLYLHRVWRMVLECGPLSTRSCEERALLPARAVRGYLFQLLHDGWIVLGDEWASITNRNPSVLQPNPLAGYSGDVLRHAAADESELTDRGTHGKERRTPTMSQHLGSMTQTLQERNTKSELIPRLSSQSRPDLSDEPDDQDSVNIAMHGSIEKNDASPDTEDVWHVDLDAVHTNVLRLCVLSMHNVLQQIQMKRATLLEHTSVLRATNKSGIEPRIYDDHVRGARHAKRQLKHLSETYYRLAETLLFFWDQPWEQKIARSS